MDERWPRPVVVQIAGAVHVHTNIWLIHWPNQLNGPDYTKIPGYLLHRFLPIQILTAISLGLLGSLWIWSKWMLFYVWHRNITWNKFSSHINTVYQAPVSFIIFCFRHMRIIITASEITFGTFRTSIFVVSSKKK